MNKIEGIEAEIEERRCHFKECSEEIFRLMNVRKQIAVELATLIEKQRGLLEAERKN
jgi:hypothetical protein